MLLIETLQTALTGADIYYWFVIGFGDINHLATPYASAFDVPIIGAIISLTVQFFFAYRVWVLGDRKHWWLSALICLVSPLSQFAFRSPYYPSQVSTVDAMAAMAGGIHVSLLRFMQSRACLRVKQAEIQGRFASGTWLKILAMVRSRVPLIAYQTDRYAPSTRSGSLATPYLTRSSPPRCFIM